MAMKKFSPVDLAYLRCSIVRVARRCAYSTRAFGCGMSFTSVSSMASGSLLRQLKPLPYSAWSGKVILLKLLVFWQLSASPIGYTPADIGTGSRWKMMAHDV